PASSLSQRIHEGFDSADTSWAALICSALFQRLVGGERQRWKNACGWPLVSGDGLGRSLRLGRLPKLSGDLDRVDPRPFSTTAVRCASGGTRGGAGGRAER